MSHENRDTQKQAVASPARPDLVIQSPQATGNMLGKCLEYALELNSRSALISRSIARLDSSTQPMLPEEDTFNKFTLET